MTKPSPMRGEIIAAAAEIIVRKGYGACTMRAVAALVDMKAGSLYYHFKSKDEIVEEILNQGIETLHARVAEAIRNLPIDAPFAGRLSAAVGVHVSSLVGKDQRYMHVYEHLPPVIKRRSRKMRETYAQLWHDLFADGVASGEVDAGIDLQLLVPYFLGGLNRVPEWMRAGGASNDRVAALAITTLLDGIRAGR
ncbi:MULTISPECIES: TetR/AcrR family transcriptional regulator [unclassified Bosea (in: a-proteobacteria)]|uniref:TetR/AcrR family transcriptional regulator n=1 Tax=unclassified Bosea (in: a-proteobacteria) TaxID=2653178 RepID=UPI00135A6817|nr:MULTISPECIES: TetR/AcrR family transcriptional regulator [unclassified Bosea (in: a-proteobacteria)]